MIDNSKRIINVDFTNIDTGGKASLMVRFNALNEIVLREALKRSVTQQPVCL
jgi:hypothetical protein